MNGYLELEWMGPITAIAFPSLRVVGEYLDVDYNANLMTFEAGKLSTVGEIEVNHNPKLNKLHSLPPTLQNGV